MPGFPRSQPVPRVTSRFTLGSGPSPSSCDDLGFYWYTDFPSVSGCFLIRRGKGGSAFPEGCNATSVDSPYQLSAKPDVLSTRLRLIRPCRGMLLTWGNVPTMLSPKGLFPSW